MRPLRALLLGIAAYGVFLLATAPAGLIPARLATATGGQVTLANATGSAWDGTARATIATYGAAIVLGEVSWRFLPSRLLAGRAAFAIEARSGALQAQAEVSRSPMAWQVRDLRANGDASTVAAIFPLAATWQPGGAIAIEAEHLTWDGERATGVANAQWRDASLALSEARPLGSWRAQAQAEGASTRITLSTTKGPLLLSGSGTLVIPGRLAFSGVARAEPGRERELEGLLNLLGPRRADGAHAIEVR
ncbi:MAG: type II secretion system protein N [Betaproteobacteria bacterium]|nr:type II secretion system protein N [Betaproteobacteria bacterium]